MVNARPGLAALAILMSGCSSTVTNRQVFSFDGAKFELVVTSIGGALGEERYELIQLSDGEEKTFFQGGNFSEFNVAARNGKLLVQMCHGFIDRAEPMLLGSGENLRLIRLNLDWNCKDKRREA